jgi:hypothetical protein
MIFLKNDYSKLSINLFDLVKIKGNKSRFKVIIVIYCILYRSDPNPETTV